MAGLFLGSSAVLDGGGIAFWLMSSAPGRSGGEGMIALVRVAGAVALSTSANARFPRREVAGFVAVLLLTGAKTEMLAPTCCCCCK